MARWKPVHTVVTVLLRASLWCTILLCAMRATNGWLLYDIVSGARRRGCLTHMRRSDRLMLVLLCWRGQLGWTVLPVETQGGYGEGSHSLQIKKGPL